MRRIHEDPTWTRAESRRLDGEGGTRPPGTPEGGPPSESEHVRAYREAMALWREEAERSATRFDAALVFRRVLDARHPDDAAPGLAGLRAARRYAAAALLLIGVGLAGAAWLGQEPAEAGEPSLDAALSVLEGSRLDLAAEQEWIRFPAPPAPRPGEER